MKNLTLLILVFLFSIPSFAQDESSESSTTIYFIRHAEKDRSSKTNRDPKLKQKGLLRAMKWSYVFANVEFDEIYSTDYKRTRETAQPTADKNNIDALTIYDPGAIDGKAFMAANKGKTVLVVGHSNTTPAFVNAILGVEKYSQIDDKNNANLYIVTITPSGEITDLLIVVD